MVDFVRHWTERTQLSTKRLVQWIGVGMSKFYDWTKRYGKVNDTTRSCRATIGWKPGSGKPLCRFLRRASLGRLPALDLHAHGCRPGSCQPRDRVSRAQAGRLASARWNRKETVKGRGFQQPLAPGPHRHVDISYVNVCGTFYYLVSVLDGCSRFIVHWELRESMKEADVEVVLQRCGRSSPAKLRESSPTLARESPRRQGL